MCLNQLGCAVNLHALCLQVVQHLNLSSTGEKHVQQLAPSIARSLLNLMSSCCEQVESHDAWEVLLTLLESTTSHPEAVLPVYNALETLCREGRGISAANYMHVVTAIRALVVSGCGVWMAAEQARDAGREAPLAFDEAQIRLSVDLLEQVAYWLQTWRQRQAQVHSLLEVSDTLYFGHSLDHFWGDRGNQFCFSYWVVQLSHLRWSYSQLCKRCSFSLLECPGNVQLLWRRSSYWFCAMVTSIGR